MGTVGRGQAGGWEEGVGLALGLQPGWRCRSPRGAGPHPICTHLVSGVRFLPLPPTTLLPPGWGGPHRPSDLGR